ncbi:MAG: hypothetical protein ABL949_12835 [Fimbriimonadaceae bacterium]
MKQILCASLFIVALASASAQKLEKALVGNWQVIPSTISYVPTAKAKAEMAKQKGSAEQLVGMLKKSMEGLVFSFKADHTCAVSAKAPDGTTKAQRGKWSMKGSIVKVVMEAQGQKAPPNLTMSADGKKLSVKQGDPQMGTFSMSFSKK